MQVTIFADIFEKSKPYYQPVNSILYYIKTGRWQRQVEEIRKLTEKKERDIKKRYLPSICFSGKFKTRFDNDIIEHSGFAILDFDHIENLEEFKATICKDPYTYSAFVSPSGDGLKVLVKIPAVITDHEAHYLGLIAKYPNLDKTSRNISRVCFASYDPDIYINEQSEVFTTKGKIEVTEKSILLPQCKNTDFAKMNVACEMIRNAPDGQKHYELIRASRLVGGFISGGLVDEYQAIQMLENEISNKKVDDFNGARKTIIDGVEFGKKSPIYEQTFTQRLKTIMKEDIIIETEPARDVVYLDEVRDKIIYSFDNGTSRGETTHFPDLDEVFRMKRGEITGMHGYSNHGKSTFMYQLALMKAVFDNQKFGIFSPENMPEEEFYKDIIYSYVGKSTEKHHSNQMTKQELNEAMDFVAQHFFLLYPKDDTPTPDYINQRFREMIIKHNIDGCIIDPYNQLDNDIMKRGGREDLYISHFLTSCKRFAVEHNVFYFIVTHPNSNYESSGKNLDIPMINKIAGGGTWWAKLDNVLAVHRPLFNTNKADRTVYIESQKIKKQKLNGRPGRVLFDYYYETGRYTQQTNFFNPLTKETKLPCEPLNPPRDKTAYQTDFEWQTIPDKKIPF